MTKLSIREASERFGLSRARLYKLLEKGKIDGFRSLQKGYSAKCSWIDVASLERYLNTQPKEKGGAPEIVGTDKYVPVKVAAQKTGYSIGYIYRLAKKGSLGVKRPISGNGWLVCLDDFKFLKRSKNMFT